MNWLNRNVSPIGVDVGVQQVKLAQLSGRPRQWRIENAATIARAEPGITLTSTDVRRLQEVMLRRGFVGRRIVLATPAHKLLAGALELPAAAANVPVPQIARMELARTHRRDPHRLELAFWDLPAPARSSELTHVYAAACEHKDAEQYLDLFEEQGLEVAALDVQALALMRACAPLMRDAEAVTAILDVGWSSARMVLAHHGAMVFERTFEEGGIEPVHRVLAHRFNLEPEVIEQLLRRGDGPDGSTQGGAGVLRELMLECRSVLNAQFDAIVQELQVSFSYATHQFPDAQVEQLLLVGGGATLPGMAQRLADALEVNVQVARATEVATSPRQAMACDTGLLIAAIGLAQWRE